MIKPYNFVDCFQVSFPFDLWISINCYTSVISISIKQITHHHHYHHHCLWPLDCFVGLVVRRPPWERKILGSNPPCARIFSRPSHTSDLKTGTPVATLPGAWRYRVSAGTGRPGVSILWLDEVESSICNFYLSVAACKIVCADPSLRYTSMLMGR